MLKVMFRTLGILCIALIVMLYAHGMPLPKLVVDGADSHWSPWNNAQMTVRDNAVQFDIKKRDQGIVHLVKNLAPRIYDVEITVRGNGLIQGRILADQEIRTTWYRLTSEWQTFSCRMRLSKPTFALGLVAPWNDNPPNSTCELKKITFTEYQTIATENVDIPGIRIEAEDLAINKPNTTFIRQDQTASGNRIVIGQKWQTVMNLAIPATSKKLYLYAKAKTISPRQSTLEIGSVHRVLSSIPLPNTWTWIRSTPLHYHTTDGKLYVKSSGKTESNGIAVDYVVISTNPNLTESSIPKPPHADRGLLTVGRCATAPEIDGNLDDDAWQEAIALEGFRRMTDGQPAQEQSTAKFVYDENALYFAFLAKETCLDPVACLLHAFKRSTKHNDDTKIYTDDAVLFIIRPHSQAKAYEFVVNGNGRLLDSEMTVPNLWATRRLAWNSNAKVKTAIGKGFWTVEMSIPWKALNMRPEDGLPSTFITGRWEQRLKEISAWQPFQKGLHNPDNHGIMRFADHVPAIHTWNFPNFSYGKNSLTCDFDAGVQTPYQLLQELRYAHEAPIRHTANARDKADFNLASNQAFQYHYEIIEPSTLKQILISPKYQISPAFTSLCSQGTGTVFLNGEKISSDRTPLSTMCNQLAVELKDNQTMDFNLEGTAFQPDSTWLYSPKPEPGWEKFDFNDSKWRNRSTEAAPKRGFYRKKIILNATRIWPNWKQGGLYLSPGFPQAISIWSGGIPNLAPPEGYRLIIELPAHVTLLGATAKNKHFTDLRIEDLGPVNDYRRYAITSRDIQCHHDQLTDDKRIVLFIQPRNNPNQDECLRYYTEAPSLGIQEIAQTMPLRYMPAIHGRQPRKSLFLMYNFLWLGNQNLKHIMYDAYVNMGINCAQWAYSHPGLQAFDMVDSRDFSAYARKYPGTQRIGIDGKPSPFHFCPLEFRTERGKDFIAQYITKKLNRHHAEHLNWDYEENVWKATSTCACFCPQCRREFARQFKLSTPCPSIKLIRDTYEKQWTAFTNSHFATLCDIIHRVTSARIPAVPFSVFSYFQCDQTLWDFGVDWSLLKGKVDLALVGYGRPRAQLKETRRVFDHQGKMLNGVMPPVFNKSNFSAPHQFTPASVLQYLLDGDGGVFFFCYNLFDARTFWAIGEVSRLVAENEDFFLTRNDASKDWKLDKIAKDYVRIWKTQHETLIVLFNPEKTPMNFQITNPRTSCQFSGSLKPGELKTFKSR